MAAILYTEADFAAAMTEGDRWDSVWDPADTAANELAVRRAAAYYAKAQAIATWLAYHESRPAPSIPMAFEPTKNG